MQISAARRILRALQAANTLRLGPRFPETGSRLRGRQRTKLSLQVPLQNRKQLQLPTAFDMTGYLFSHCSNWSWISGYLFVVCWIISKPFWLVSEGTVNGCDISRARTVVLWGSVRFDPGSIQKSTLEHVESALQKGDLYTKALVFAVFDR